MVRELSFKSLPFDPESGQVIYVESSYHKKLNTFILDHYTWLRKTFHRHGLEFCYLPNLFDETVHYHAPYLKDEECRAIIDGLPSLTDYAIDGETIEPSLVFALDIPVEDAEGNTVLQSVAIEPKWYRPNKRTFALLAKEVKRVAVERSIYYHELRKPERKGEDDEGGHVRFSIGDVDERVVPRRGQLADYADNHFDSESRELIEEIRARVKALRLKGVNTLFIHGIIDECERLSRLRITKDYRIFLVDYNNMEIRLAVLPKAVFFLFLHHPEGIRFKELSDYYPELLQIYLKLRPIGGRMRQEQSIRDITNPCSNSINEKCARIREAFICNFDERLAKNYFITGRRGEPKSIMLDPSMVIWE